METIWKYRLNPNINEIELPASSKVLTADVQKEDINIWVQQNPDEEKIVKKFEVVPTGGHVPNNYKYISTCLLHNGRLVLHVYQIL